MSNPDGFEAWLPEAGSSLFGLDRTSPATRFTRKFSWKERLIWRLDEISLGDMVRAIRNVGQTLSRLTIRIRTGGRK